MFKTIPNNLKDANIILSGELKSICPITEEQDTYQFSINYVPKELLIEVISFREYLEGFEHFQLYSEDIFQTISDIIIKIVDPLELEVSLVDNSPGVRIEVKTKCV